MSTLKESKPQSSNNDGPQRGASKLVYAVYLLMSAAGFYLMRVVPTAYGAGEYVKNATETRRFSENAEIELRTEYTGIAAFDSVLTFVVSCFLPGVRGFDSGARLQSIHFLVSLFPIVVIMAIESVRKRNHMALISFPSIWALAYQSTGGAVILPLYLILFHRLSMSKDYFSQPRQISLSHAQALMPAVLIGYLVPTCLMFWEALDSNTQQGVIAIWQFSPLYAGILLHVFGYGFYLLGADSPEAWAPNKDADMRYLREMYALCFLSSLAVHAAAWFIGYTSEDPQQSLLHAFWFDLKEENASMTFTEVLHFIFKADEWLVFGATMIWGLVSVWELNSVGRTDVGLFWPAVMMVVGAVMVGPAAVLSGVWFWREEELKIKPEEKKE